MSAEPAHPGPDPRRPARVITFPTASRPPRHKRQETRVPADPLTPEQRLAASVERTFNEHGRTLTDEATAEAFGITLGVVRKLLEGARHSEVLDDGQHRELDALYLGMLAAPGILSGE